MHLFYSGQPPDILSGLLKYSANMEKYLSDYDTLLYLHRRYWACYSPEPNSHLVLFRILIYYNVIL